MTVSIQMLEQLFANEVARNAWPFFRIAGALMVAPLFGARLVPARVRLMLTLALTICLAPIVPAQASFEPSVASGLLIAHELLLGIAIGFTLQMIFDALVVAGQTIAMSMGLGFAMLVDPQRGVSVPVVSQFFVILGMLVFLSLGGHLALIELVANSFVVLPVGETLSSRSVWTLLVWAGQIFAGALRIALPAVTALLVVNLAFGVMSRAAPTLNLFAVGFPVALLLGFIVLLFTVSSFPAVFSSLLESALGNAAALLE